MKNINILNMLKKYKKTSILVVIILLSIGGYIVYNNYFSEDAKIARYFEFNSETGTITGYNNDKLKDVVIPSKINGKEVKAIGDDAFIMEDLTSVVIPNTVTKIGIEAFANNKLKSITIPNSVTYIGELAFLENSLTNLEIPSSVKTIGYGAFNRNNLPNNQAFIYNRNEDGSIDYTTIVSYGGLNKNIVIPDGVTTIARYAFLSSSIETVEISASVTSIQYGAFTRNPITKVTIKGDNQQRFNEGWYNIGFDSVPRP